MRVDGDLIVFEYLTAVNASSIGADTPITVKAPSEPFHASNAPGEPKEVDGREYIERMGRDTVSNFNTIFA